MVNYHRKSLKCVFMLQSVLEFNFIAYQEIFLKNGNSGKAARKEERAMET